MHINPSPPKAGPGDEITVIVEAQIAGNGISGSEIMVEFDPSMCQVIGLEPGELLGDSPLVGAEEIDNQRGAIHYASARKGMTQPTDCMGSLATINFKVNDSSPNGTCNLTLKEVNLTNEQFGEISGFAIQNGVVEVVP